MRILYKKVTLEYFKGVRNLEVEFNDDTTRISGANRTGKTTVADAITWCLFGKDSAGRTQFGIKTRENGVEIPDLQHTVTLEIDIDGTAHTLQRTLSERRSKGRGTDETMLMGNVTECYIDGVKTTMRDYQAFISSIMPEDKFRILTSPVFFTAMNWEEQRRMLMELCPKASVEDIASKAVSMGMSSDDVDYVVKMLKTASLQDAVKHLSYLGKKVEGELDDIPTRIEENSMAMPDYTEDVDSKLSSVREQLQLAKAGSVGAEAKSIAHKIEFAETRLANIRQSAASKAMREKNEIEQRVSQCEYDIDSCRKKLKSLEASVSNEQATIERTNKQVESLQEEAVEIRNKWAENGARKLSISETDTVCPTCGQPLPQDKLKQHVEEMRKRFADNKAETYKRLTEEATQVKKDLAHAQHIIDVANANIATTNEQFGETKKLLAQLEDNLISAGKEKARTAEEILSEDENYATILQELDSLKAQLGKVDTEEDNHEEIVRLKGEETELVKAKQRNELREQITNRISQLRDKQSELNKQLSQIERRQEAAKIMMQVQDDILETNVNKLFHYTQFRLFRTQVNGQRVPYCEAMVGGVPFADVNSAAKINAGIDIISTLSLHNDFYAPVIIDNAESVNQILPNNNQNILFYVTEERQLTVQP